MQDNCTPEFGDLDPLRCNTGVHRKPTSRFDPLWALDWLRLSFSEKHLDSLLQAFQRAGFHALRDRPRLGYQHAIGFAFDVVSTVPNFHIWYGGSSQNGRALLDVSGGGAKLVYEVVRGLDIPFALNRVDLALDFDSGSFLSVQDALMHIWERKWPYRGTKPKVHKIDDMGQGTGCTLYFGRKDGECLVRLYEKGKQLRDPNRSEWLRFEVEVKPDGDFKRMAMWGILRSGRFHELACSGFSAALIPAVCDCAADRFFIHEPKIDRDFEDRLVAMLRQYGGLIGEIRERAGGDWDEFGQIIKAGFDVITRSKTTPEVQVITDIPY